MNKSETLLFYLLALAGLIVISILFTGRIEAPAVESSSTRPTPAATKARPPRRSPQNPCPASPQKVIQVGPAITDRADDRWLISGTVYASDSATLLEHVQIEIWRAPLENRYTPGSLYRFDDGFQSDAAGLYEISTLKLTQPDVIYLYFRVPAQDDCPFVLQLILVDEAVPGGAAPVPQTQGESGGLLLSGPVDVVLPVPPPVP